METKSGTVKWYDPERGYGFITTLETADNKPEDALLLSSVLSKYGAESVSKDSEVVVELKRSSRGLAVSSIVSLKIVPVVDNFAPASVKWYNVEKGFGFVVIHGTEDDIFIHAEVVRKANMALESDQNVLVRTINGAKGKKVVEVKEYAVAPVPSVASEPVKSENRLPD